MHTDLIEFLAENARRVGAREPAGADDLFDSGIVDSFTLVELVSKIEEAYGITIPDADVKPETFGSIEKIEQYVKANTVDS